MNFFEIALLALLAVQTLLLLAAVSMLASIGRRLDFKLNMIDGSLDRIQ